MKRLAAWVLAMALVLCCGAVCPGKGKAEEDWMMFSSRTEPYYSEVFREYTLPVYAGDPIETKAGKQIASTMAFWYRQTKKKSNRTHFHLGWNSFLDRRTPQR